MSQHHDQFKLIPVKVKELRDLENILSDISLWAVEEGLCPKSIGIVDLTYEDILISIGYTIPEDPYKVKFVVKELGTCEQVERLKNEDLEYRVNLFEEDLTDVLDQALVVVRIPGNEEDEDVLVMVVMTKA